MFQPGRLRFPLSRLGCLCALLAGLLWAPLAPALAAHEAGMACCRNGKKHACCSRLAKKRMGRAHSAAITALATCGKSCCQKSSLPSADSAQLIAPPAPGRLLVLSQPLLIAGTGRGVATPLPQPLFQRPPPALFVL
ncbi:MAG: hypothetical protein K7J46_08285 [Bryobacter sp.]|nr:hypothetical protein [Bryobacter sp. CoA8 C33]